MREAKDLTDEELRDMYIQTKKDADYKYSILKDLENEIDRRCNKDRFVKEEK